MTAEPTTFPPVVLRRLSSADDLGGVAALMAGYVAEIRRNLLEGHGLRLEDATPDSGKIVEIWFDQSDSAAKFSPGMPLSLPARRSRKDFPATSM